MQKKILITIGLFAGLIFYSCAPQHSQIILSKFDHQNVKMGEFEKAYLKNAEGNVEADKDSLDKLKDYLKLYTQFRMKVLYAKENGYNKDPELQQELKNYKDNVAQSLYLDSVIVEPGIRQLYQRRKYELKVSQIMFRAGPAGNEKVKSLATAVLDSILHGADFSQMAEKYSEDPYSKIRGGDISYVTAGELPKTMEDAAYSTPVGQVYPKLLRSNYGYHIIKVTNKKKRVPELELSHIFVNFKRKNGKVDSVTARIKIDSVMAKLKAGEDFAKAAEEYSEDPTTRKRGGVIGFVRRRQLIPALDTAGFNLKVGEISGIVTSPYGYHILKVTHEKQIPAFSSEVKELKNIFKKVDYQEEYDSLVNHLKVKYHYSIDGKNLDYLISNADSSKVGDDSLLIQKAGDKLLYTFDGDSVYVDEFLKQLNNDSKYSGQMLNSNLLTKTLRELSENRLIQKEAIKYFSKDPYFTDLMKDYKDGIYIFKLEQDKVWNKVKIDSTDLYNYYLKNKNKYKYPDRVDYGEIYNKSDSVINYVYSKLKDGVSFDSLAAKYNEKREVHKLEPVSSSTIAQRAYELQNPGDYTKPLVNSGGYSIIILNKKEPARIKTYEEAKAEVAAEYQDLVTKKLGDEFINKLKEKYNPVYYYDKLSEAFPAKGTKMDKSK